MKEAITIIGLGNMGQALTKGLLTSNLATLIKVSIYDRNQEKYKDFEENEHLTVITNTDAMVLKDGILILCIKPQDLGNVANLIKEKLDNTLVISILAGIRFEDIKRTLCYNGPIIRAMPNIAAICGCAATVMCHNDQCSCNQKSLATSVFNSVGDTYWTKEALMNTVTGLSGSGPAYIYMVIEALTDGGVKMGLPRSLSAKLATQTVLGAATLVKTSGIHPAILKDQVTTPAGTTILALHELEERGLRSMFVSAVEAATERSELLRQT